MLHHKARGPGWVHCAGEAPVGVLLQGTGAARLAGDDRGGHSLRSATVGSSLAERHAGISVAMAPIRINKSAGVTTVKAFQTSLSSCESHSWRHAAERTAPATSPTITKRSPSRAI